VIIFAQIANGLLLPIIACYLLWIMNDKALMKDHTNSLWANVFGGLVILITFGIGMKGILKAMAVI
jgi:Mn2+/Fe2+ NRAMP family transporter